MWYKFGLFASMIVVFSGCSTQKLDVNYAWQTTNTIIHDKLITIKNVQVREIKYYSKSKKNWKDGTTSYTEKEDRYLYLNPAQKLDMQNGFQAISNKYTQALLFSGESECKAKEYPCSFSKLRLKGEVYERGIRSYTLSRTLFLSSPIRMKSEKDMRNKVHSFLARL
ncbi:MAG TPA: hypothetical protein EYG93_02610 [Sulfurospirillum arcachonense]|nr:hypothetical protein [Sulfurospirillum arcachonense]HIP44213.1 hypothetical protein [Sulfurospirillum arcachonense]